MSGAAAKAAGLPTETMKKYGAGGNRSAHSAQMSRLENDTETLTHTKVSTETKKLIMQARMAKKMSQKDLATAINEKPQTIQEYESGKAIPNNQLLAKMEKVLGTRLRPPKGKKK
jgi:putative transcription factor